MFRTTMTLDTTQKVMTGVVLTLVLVVTASTVLAAGAGGVPVHWVTLPLLALVLGALVLSWAMAPRAIVVDGDELRIERRAWSALRVKRAEIVSAAPLARLGERVLRLFGVGGFFGSYGLFRSSTLGRFRLYATRSGMAVLVRRTEGLPIVVTPDDVDGMIEAVDPRSAS
jgi:hypothetical protein